MASSARSLTRGFTLIELLIVIALIGILTAVASVSYGAVQKRARDSRRVSDLKSVQNAFEQYYADNSNGYPESCDIDSSYLANGIPTDPKSNTSYKQTDDQDAVCTTTGYCLCAHLENAGGNASDAQCSKATGGDHYCVWQLQ